MSDVNVQNSKSNDGSKKDKKSGISKFSNWRIILIYNVILIIVGAVFYNIIPVLLNYFPDFDAVTSRLNSASYLIQFILLFSIAIIIGTLVLLHLLKGIRLWEEHLNNRNSTELAKIRRKCLNLPYWIYISQIMIIVVLAGLYLTVQTARNDTSFIFIPKLIIMLFSLLALAGILSLIFSKRVFTNILRNTYTGEELQGTRIAIRGKIFLQILPLFIVAILFTSLLGYSRMIDEKNNLIFKNYKNQLEDKFEKYTVKDISQIKERINQIKLDNASDRTFIITPRKKVITSDKSELGKVFLIYAEDLAHRHNGHVYSDEGETNGSIITIKDINGAEWTVGVKYVVVSSQTIGIFLFSFIVLLLLSIFVLYYLSKSFADDIKLVADNLNEIAEGESVDLDRKIPVTSNDEIGDLVVAFNKILDKEKEHIKEVKEQQSILMEQERLASLGHLIGGIAHNLRTPIMSLSGGIEGLKDLIKEYDESIDDGNVTKEDHHEIAKEMSVWIEKMRPYCTYMSDIITAVKGQTIQPGEKSALNFTLDELCKRIDILLEHELKNMHCKMKMDIKADRNIQINGEISVLIQVLNNLIINSVEAYEGKGGDIDFVITSSQKTIEFIIKDYGNGIQEEIKSKLFKEMITTKGSKGTGLGLYMSYSNIKARFGGKIWFESEKGAGTTFHIYIPCK